MVASVSLWPATSRGWRLAMGALFALLAVGAWMGLETLERWESDETLFRASVEVEPDSARARCNLAKVLIESGRLDEARGHLEAALERVPDYPLALLNLSAVLERQRPGDEEAWRLAHRAVQVTPRPGKAQANVCALAMSRRGLDSR